VKQSLKTPTHKTNWPEQWVLPSPPRFTKPNWFRLWLLTSLGFLLMTGIVIYQSAILDSQTELISWLLKRVIDLGGFNGRV
jgi:hypothetical protein